MQRIVRFTSLQHAQHHHRQPTSHSYSSSLLGVLASARGEMISTVALPTPTSIRVSPVSSNSTGISWRLVGGFVCIGSDLGVCGQYRSFRRAVNWRGRIYGGRMGLVIRVRGPSGWWTMRLDCLYPRTHRPRCPQLYQLFFYDTHRESWGRFSIMVFFALHLLYSRSIEVPRSATDPDFPTVFE